LLIRQHWPVSLTAWNRLHGESAGGEDKSFALLSDNASDHPRGLAGCRLDHVLIRGDAAINQKLPKAADGIDRHMPVTARHRMNRVRDSGDRNLQERLDDDGHG